MARKKSKTLTEGELRIMDVLWNLKQASVKQVTETLAEQDEPVAYNTVLTMLRILKKKGYAAYRKEGRAFIYSPLVGRDQARNSVVRYLVRQFFNNSPELLVQNLLEDESLDQAELERLKAMIAETEASE